MVPEVDLSHLQYKLQSVKKILIFNLEILDYKPKTKQLLPVTDQIFHSQWKYELVPHLRKFCYVLFHKINFLQSIFILVSRSNIMCTLIADMANWCSDDGEFKGSFLVHVKTNFRFRWLIADVLITDYGKGQTRRTRLPRLRGLGGVGPTWAWRIHPYPAFMQEVVSTTRTHDLQATWQHPYRCSKPNKFNLGGCVC